MGRPKTEIGEWGKITVDREGEKFVARARVRNLRGRLQTVERSAETSDLARSRLKEAMRAEARKVEDAEITRDTPFRVLAAAYLDTVRRSTLTATTYDRYTHNINSVLLPEIGELPLRSLTTRRLQVLFNSLADAGRSPAGLANLRAPLSGALKLAVLEEVFTANPMAGVQLTRKTSAYSADALDRDDIGKLLAAVEKDQRIGKLELYDIVVLMLGTGCRISEILGLTWSDVTLGEDWRECALLIRHNAVRVKGVGMTRQDGKTRAARRDILMTPMVREVMRRRAAIPGNHAALPVFPVRGHGRPRASSGVVRLLRPHYEDIPTLRDTKQPTHIFRKTAATIMLDQGLSPREVADQLGHASVSMVLDVYGQRRQRSERAMNALDFTRGERPQLTS
ncbi:tyrosine-type recombinase/integrase [Actinomycetospora aeridis]|uniref:Tyrosine-type recombinase/integrase n=1 Tax=Actinomycetospora aeridis TaxID=3129231 RepID=A0ABU8N3D5_9PSEU